jgi:hypothetical protein
MVASSYSVVRSCEDAIGMLRFVDQGLRDCRNTELSIRNTVTMMFWGDELRMAFENKS